MSSGDYFPFAGRPRRPYTPHLPDLLPDPAASQILRRFPVKRSLADFQAQHRHDNNQALSFYLPNVKARALGFPMQNTEITPNHLSPSSPFNCYPNLVPNRVINDKLQELENHLLNDDDNDDDEGDTSSVITNNSEWSDTWHHLIGPPPPSLSPSSSSSSCSSSSPHNLPPKQSLIEAATAISENKPELAREILTRLSQGACVTGTPEQRLTAYLTAALLMRVDHAPDVRVLYSEDHALSTQMLYEVSPCFRLGFMAANLAILEAASSDRDYSNLHVVDFDIGRGRHLVHLIHTLAARKRPSPLRITAVTEFGNEHVARAKSVGDELKALASRLGVSLVFNAWSLNVSDLSPEKLGVEKEEKLAVNLSFKLYKLPDESVTTDNLRDELLRRVKGLSPVVVTVVEQEMNANTAPFLARVNEACGYYGALFDSLDSTVPRDNSDRVGIEKGLGRKLANSVACEGRERVERCEVLGKWRARMGMAGFKPWPINRSITESLRSQLGSGTRGNPGFTVREENGSILFGWMGRTLTVASAWQ